jgi:flavin reductase (DIM6/NTAB) family NADH-FMN oxidoreductase RutF
MNADAMIEVPVRTTPVLNLLPPYPIVLVSTRTNIITINQIEYFTFSPLRIGIAVAHARYTYELLKEERVFVVNVPGARLVDEVKLCGAVSGREGDKFELAGLTPQPFERDDVAAVGIAECEAQIACRVEREIDFENRTWFVGPVVAARSRPDHTSTAALMCGREAYYLPGEAVSPR